MNNINYNLNQLAKLYGITDIAKTLNRTYSTVWKYVNCSRVISVNSLNKLCNKYNINYDDFINSKLEIRLTKKSEDE